VVINIQSVQNIDQKNYSLGELEAFCDEILNLDSKIRFAGIITDKGKLLAENKRKGLKVLIDPKDLEILLMEIALGVRMRREHDAQLGPVNFTISCALNMISIIFPFETGILCITAEKDLDFFKIPFLIFQLLETKIIKKELV
jgi:hypothetical protein